MPPAAEVYIQATDTDPDVRARAHVEEAHRQVLERLDALVRLEGAVETAGGEEDAAGTGDSTGDTQELATVIAREVQGLLAAADRTLYAAASGAAETRLLVRGLRVAAGVAGRYADSLSAAGPAERAGEARVLAGALTAQLETERAVLMPALAALKGVELRALVEDFTTCLGGGELTDPAVLDVREIPHGQRHPRIFTRFARLAGGESFVLVNNHDPKPLRREFDAAHPEGFSWEYVESGPEQWQIRITRRADDA